ncbi:hypothetical protein BKA70DRAFT_1460245 [Coprinopsis sp. MPI-PUGE-AT-0042]|nr:hypothetical protein BKA70DRAFT_1460245 [Coprinopsis sp. MPI-PUGE-AT-0042]
MPSHRSRSRSRSQERNRKRHRSRERSRDRHRDRSRSRSPERPVDLPDGAKPLTEKDYFQRSDEFRLWLKEEKEKYFDELSGERARSYFRKFIKVWKYYRGIEPGTLTATANTSYKWSFAAKGNRADNEALKNARAEVGAATYGPTLPSAADLTMAAELDKEQEAELRAYKRKREKMEAKERVEDMVGPKPVGREAMLEKKRARRENDKAFREKGDEGLEVDEDTLLGGGDSFPSSVNSLRLARRDAAKKRNEARRSEDVAFARERATVLKEKDKVCSRLYVTIPPQAYGCHRPRWTCSSSLQSSDSAERFR